MATFYGWDTAPVDLGPSPYQIVGMSDVLTSNGTLTWPEGTLAGDIALTVGIGTSGLLPSGFTFLDNYFTFGPPGTSVASFGYKVLASGDLPGINVTNPTNGHCYGIVIRGATVTEASPAKAPPDNLGPSCTIPGFTKALGSQILVCIAVDRDPVADFGPPSGWDELGRSQSMYFASCASWMDSSGYTNNTTVTAPLHDGTLHGGALIYEFRIP